MEFALLLPVLILLAGGIGEYGGVFWQQSNIVAATREGVRIGVIEDQAAEAVPRVRAVLNNFGMDGAAATVTAVTSGTAPTRVLTVTVTMPYDDIMNGFGELVAPAELTNSATMLLETQ